MLYEWFFFSFFTLQMGTTTTVIHLTFVPTYPIATAVWVADAESTGSQDMCIVYIA